MHIPVYVLAAGSAFTVLLILASRNPDWLKRKRRAGQQVPRIEFPPLPPPVSVPWPGFEPHSYEQYRTHVERYGRMNAAERDSDVGRYLVVQIQSWHKIAQDSQDPTHSSYPGWKWSHIPSPTPPPPSMSTLSTTYRLTGKATTIAPEARVYTATFTQLAPPPDPAKPATLNTIQWLGMAAAGELTITGLTAKALEELPEGDYTITITKIQ